MPAPKRNIPRPPSAPDAPEQYGSAERTHEHAAEARRDAFAAVKPADRGMVDALLAERRGYEQRGGMADRIGQVDEQLRTRGYGA